MDSFAPSQSVVDFKISSYYRYLLYVATTIFVGSLFFEVRAADLYLVRWLSAGVVFACCLIWIAEKTVINIRVSKVLDSAKRGNSAAGQTYIDWMLEEHWVLATIHLIIWVLFVAIFIVPIMG